MKQFIVSLHLSGTAVTIWRSQPLDQLTMYTLMGILSGDPETVVTCEPYIEEVGEFITSGEPG